MLEALERAMPGGIDLNDIPAARAAFSDVSADEAPPPIPPGVTSSDHYAPGPRGAPDVMVRIYRPEAGSAGLPALLWIHGGGYVLGSVDGNNFKAGSLALALNCLVASVEYRLAPENPFPAPLEDCYAALQWLTRINGSRIAVGGASAGGGLAAALALAARDRAEVNIRYQLLIYPMIDDRSTQQASADLPDAPVWTRANNLIGWRAYLGREPGGDDISPYAAAGRAEDLSGLPPAFIGVGTHDLFRNENITYARRLMDCGVPTELHVYADGFHAFDGAAPDSDAARRFTAEYTRLLKRALHGPERLNGTIQSPPVPNG